MATRRSRFELFALGAAMLGLAACGGGFSAKQLASTPSWFKAKEKELRKQDYPDLAAVPDPAVAADQAGKWRAVEKDLLDAAAVIDADPRSQPAPATDNAAFEAEARGAIDNARPKK